MSKSERLEARIDGEVVDALLFIMARRKLSKTSAIIQAILDYAERLGWKAKPIPPDPDGYDGPYHSDNIGA